MSKARFALEWHRAEILALAEEYRFRRVRVFGSVANGTDDEDSDLDLLIEMPENGSLLALGGFLMDVRDLLGIRVDVISEGMLKPRVRERILREAIPV